jgi:hypothetical protein
MNEKIANYHEWGTVGSSADNDNQGRPIISIPVYDAQRTRVLRSKEKKEVRNRSDMLGEIRTKSRWLDQWDHPNGVLKDGDLVCLGMEVTTLLRRGVCYDSNILR